MKYCRKCNTIGYLDDTYCYKCGAVLAESKCKHCLALVSRMDCFCSKCGEALK